MIEQLKTYSIKPEQAVTMSEFTQMINDYLIPVNNGDNGILLVAYTEHENCNVYIAPGDGVFAGDEKSIHLQPNKYTFVYLESGPFMIHEGENRGHIRLYSDVEEVNAAAILLK